MREIFRTTAKETKVDAKDYKKAMSSHLPNILSRRRISVLPGQTFLAMKPTPGERINNFVTRLSSLAEHFKYGDENCEKRASSHTSRTKT